MAKDERQRDDSPNPDADLDALNNEQLISVAKGLRQENGRIHKKLGETEATVLHLGTTVQEQSDTLQNREGIVSDFEGRVEQYEQRIDTLLLDIEGKNAIIDSAEKMIQKREAALLERPSTGQNVQDLAEALEAYGLAVARVSDTMHAPHVAVTLIQMAMHIGGMDWPTAMAWLKGEPLKTVS